MMLPCPAETPCRRCKALIPKGVRATKVVLGSVTLWYHLACCREPASEEHDGRDLPGSHPMLPL
jgi:hypothetical protein